MKMALIASALSFISFLSIGASAQEKYPVRQIEELPGVVLIDEDSAKEISDASNAQPSSTAQSPKITSVLSKLSQSDYCKIAAEYYLKTYRESERSYGADERQHVVLKMETDCRSAVNDPELAIAAVRRNSEMNPGTAASAKWFQDFISSFVALTLLMPH